MTQESFTPHVTTSDFPVSHGPTPPTTLAEFITLLHAIKQEVHEPRPSLIDNYNSLVEIRDLIDNFEKAH